MMAIWFIKIFIGYFFIVVGIAQTVVSPTLQLAKRYTIVLPQIFNPSLNHHPGNDTALL